MILECTIWQEMSQNGFQMFTDPLLTTRQMTLIIIGAMSFKEIIGPDGKAEIIQPDQLVYDTLPNGKVLLKESLSTKTGSN